MKPQTNVFDVQSTVQGQKVAMGIDEAAMGHVMGILANMYSNKPRAIVREYSTNAFDAQIEAGVNRAIEVELPSQLSQFFRVRDFGIGLDREGIETVYSKYGASTKRASNAFNGMLGIGCKSALAYQQQFLVSSIKNGNRIEVAVGRNADGSGYMHVQTEYPTDQPDGTTVSVPVERNDISRFASEAYGFFRHWPKGSVLINEREPEHFTGLKVAEGVFIDEGSPRSLIVMGNVAYPVPELDNLITAYNASVTAFVPIGAVEFAPSREALQYTDLTRATIEQIRIDFTAGIKVSAQREIEKAATPRDAVDAILSWDRYVSGSAVNVYTYKGVSLPRTLRAVPYDPPRTAKLSYGATHTLENKFRIVATNTSQLPRGFNERRNLDVDMRHAIGGLFVTDFKPEKLVIDHVRKLRKWSEDNGKQFSHFIICDEGAPDSPWITHTVDWETIKKIKLNPADKSASGRIPGSYDLYTEDTVYGGKNRFGTPYNAYGKRGVPGDDIRSGVPLFHCHGNLHSAHTFAAILHAFLPAFTLVCLSENRIPKWEREVTRSQKVYTQFAKLGEEWMKSLTQDDKTAISVMDNGNFNTFRRMDESKVNDPALKQAIRVVKDSNVQKRVQPLIAKRDKLRGFGRVDLSEKCPLAKYSLFCDRTLDSDPGHVYIYLNAIHAAN